MLPRLFFLYGLLDVLVSGARTEKGDITQMRLWAEERGAYLNPSVRVLDAGQMGRGLIADKKVAAGELLFYLPREVWLSDEQAKVLLSEVLTDEQQSTLDRAINNEIEGCTKHSWYLTLMVLLLGESAPSPDSSPVPPAIEEWRPLVHTMPKNCVGEVCDKVTTHRRDTEREMWMRRCLAGLRTLGKRITPTFNDRGVFGPLNDKQMLWAISMVTSRLQIISEDEPPRLVPFLDFLNAHPSDDCCSSSPKIPSTSCADDNPACVTSDGKYLTNYTARRAFLKGEQLYEVYGDLTGVELALLYGIEGKMVNGRMEYSFPQTVQLEL